MTPNRWHQRLLTASVPTLMCAALSLTTAPARGQDDTTTANGERVTEEVVVTGTRIKRRDFSSISPLTTLDITDIEFSGRPTLEELLNLMPQVMPDFGRTSNNPGDGTARINLRGLGAGRTLVLVNGRRLAPSGVESAVDANNLPQALVERVEIITGGTTAVYGSDAIAGVVNFITRDNFEGISLDASYGITEEGDADTRDLNFAFGQNLADGRGNVTFFAGALERENLFAAAREFTRVALEDDFQGNLVPRGNARTPELVIFAPVDVGDGPIFPIFEPDGTFRGFQLPDDLYNFAPDNYLQVPLTRISAAVMADYELSSAAEAYLEVGYANNESKQTLAPVPAAGTLTVNLDSPVLTPETRQMLADNFMVGPNLATFPYGRRMSELGSRIVDHDRDYWRTVFGIRGNLPGEWEYDGWLTYTDASEKEAFENDVSRSRLAQGLLVDAVTGQCVDMSGGCVPVNVFGAGNISAEAADFIRITDVQNTTDRKQTLAGFFATGPLGATWAGDIDGAFGLEWRRDKGSFSADEVLFLGDTLGFSGRSAISGAEEVWELYGETVIPLAAGTSWAEYLGLEIGARHSDYKLAGGQWTYKLGGEWAPTHGVRLRAMHQRSVRAPNLAELFEEQFTELGAVVNVPTPDLCSASLDPVGNGYAEKCILQGLPPDQVGVFEAPEVVFGEVVQGGNTRLRPEKANTFTLGAVLDLDAVPKWSFAIDYFEFEVEDTIGQISARSICFDPLNTANMFCGNIERDASGNISRIVELIDNRGLLETSGIDLQARYVTDLPKSLSIGSAAATLELNTIWSHMLGFDQQENPVTQVFDCAGRFGQPCGETFAENRLTSYANYAAGPWFLHLTWRWIEGTANAAPLTIEFQSLPGAELAIPDVGARSYVDFGIGYSFGERFTARLNINNLFETDPPQMANAVLSNNTDTGIYDVFGRSYFLSFSSELGR